ncbi:MAG TPA: minor capsid protein [Syntrophomonadaceae bacterium]|nr:minor capsid protein [Syntrophomonadaceae bacterium]
MDPQRLYKQLDVTEKQVLSRWDRWIHQTFDSIPWREYERLQRIGGPRALAQAPAITTNAGTLARIISNHAVEMLMAGQAHAQLLVDDLHRQYRGKGRKLADYPTFDFNYTDDPRVIPEKAIKAMEARSVALAGDVDGSMLAGMKKIMSSFLAGTARPEAEVALEALLNSTQERASLITTTETTYGYNRGRLVGYRENLVDYVRFSAIRDFRTSQICISRHGLLMAMDDPQLGSNTPPLHGRCRSVLDPVYSAYQPELIVKRNLDWSYAAPLPKGWAA